MRVLIAGPLDPFSGAEFYAHVLRSWARALVRHGLECSLVQFGQLEHWMGTAVSPRRSDAFFMVRRHVPWMGQLAERAETGMLCRHIEAFRPDATVVVSQWPEDPVGMVSRIRAAGSGPLFGWLGGPPDRAARNGRLLEFLAQLDAVVVYDPENVQPLQRAGVGDVRVLPLAADTEYIRRVLGTQEIGRDIPIGFCGRIDDDRARYLEQLTDLGLVVWSDSRVRSPALGHCVREAVSGSDMYRALARCKIGLNVHHPMEVSGGNARTYEVPACGALLLSDAKPFVWKAFVPDREVVLFNSPDGARTAALRLLADASRLASIAHLGRLRVEASHSVDARVGVLIGWMNEASARGRRSVKRDVERSGAAGEVGR